MTKSDLGLHSRYDINKFLLGRYCEDTPVSTLLLLATLCGCSLKWVSKFPILVGAVFRVGVPPLASLGYSLCS